MSAAESVTTAARALGQARANLERRSDEEIVRALGSVLELWRDPDSTCRRELEAKLPDSTGFSVDTVRAGLDLGFAPWTARAFDRLVEDELGAISETGMRSARGHARTALVLAGSIPMPSVLSIVLPLVLRSPVLCKPASRDVVTANLVAASIRAIDPLLGDCVAIAPFEKDDVPAAKAFFSAPCVVATGSNETIEEVANQLTPDQARLFYGHRVSIAAIELEALNRETLATTTDQLAIDIALWDQLGCLSPAAFYLVGGDDDAAHEFADALATSLAKKEHDWPRGTITVEAAATIARERSEAEMRSALGHSTLIRASEGTQWTIVVEHDSTSRTAPLHRFIRVIRVRDVSELMATLEPIANVLAGVALAGFDEGRDALTRDLLQLGASRVCAPGQLQAPPINWPRDNQPLLRGLVAGNRRGSRLESE